MPSLFERQHGMVKFAKIIDVEGRQVLVTCLRDHREKDAWMLVITCTIKFPDHICENFDTYACDSWKGVQKKFNNYDLDQAVDFVKTIIERHNATYN